MPLDPLAVYQRALAVLDATEAQRADAEARRARRLAGEEPRMWQAPAPSPELQAKAALPIEQPARPDWNRWADARIARALDAFSGRMADGVGEALGEVRRELREEFGSEQARLLVRLMALEAEHAGRQVSRLRSITGGEHERAA